MSKENIQGFEKKDVAKVTETTQDSWDVTPEDIGLIKMRLEVEQRAMMDISYLQIQLSETVERAKAARKDREQTCIDMEKKLSIPAGTAWVVDFDKKALVKRK